MERGSRILLVEDEALSAVYLSMQLKKMGFAVHAVVDSGEEAIVHSGKEAPDLILMDINLAGKMNGIEAAGKIKETIDVPVIFITGYSDEEIRTQADMTKPLAFLVKPIDVAVLNGLLMSVLADPQSRDTGH